MKSSKIKNNKKIFIMKILIYQSRNNNKNCYNTTNSII